MAADADVATIRVAYRARARVHHPDRAATGSSEEMAAVNEAYRVLGDPGRRSLYDRSLRSGTAASSGSAAGAASSSSGASWPADDGRRATRYNYPTDPSPARVPWRFLAVMAGAGIALVLIGAAFVQPAPEPGPDGILRPGSCVAIEANGDAVEVRCTRPDEGDDAVEWVVDRLVPTGVACPAGTVPHRDRQGLGTACIRRGA